MSELSEYVKRGKERKGSLEEIMEKRKTAKLAELEEVQLEAMIAEQKKKIQASSPERPNHVQTTDFAALLFAGRSPEEIKQIVGSLTQDEIDKMAYLAANMSNGNLAGLRGMLGERSTGAKEVLEAVKTGVEVAKIQNATGGVDLKGLAEIFKAGVEAAKAQSAPAQPQQDPLATYKVIQEMLKPFTDEIRAVRDTERQRERELNDFKLKQIESKIVNPVDYIEGVKKSAQSLGYTSGSKTELDLRMEEMKQTERLQDKQIDWEKEKFKIEADSGDRTLETIKGVLEGPAGRILENLGNAGVDRLRQGKLATSNGVTVPCPNCHKQFNADPKAMKVQCPHCNATLEKQDPRTVQPPPQIQEPLAQPQEVQQPATTEQPPTQQ